MHRSLFRSWAEYEFLIKIFLPGIRRDDGAKFQSLVFVSNIPGLNPNSLRSAYDVKIYVLLIAILPSKGDAPLSAFRK
jgi:hypothetical protein